MMKKIFTFIAVACLLILGGASVVSIANAATILFPGGGGTGWGYPGGLQAHTILIGNGINPISTTSPSTSGYVLTSNGVGSDPTFQALPPSGSFPFTPTTNFGVAVNSTSTPLWDTAGLMASSTSYFGTTGQTSINSNGTITVGGVAGTATSTFATGITVGTGYAPYPEYSFNADPNTGIDSTAPDVMNLVNAGINTMTLSSSNKVGIGSSSPSEALSVMGNAQVSGNISGANLTATGTLNVTGQTTLATALSGFLKATAGVVSSALVDLTANVTGILPIANGGTNASSFTTSGNAVYYDGTRLSTAPTTAAITIPYASTTVMSSTGSAYFATSGGNVGIASSTPFSKLSIDAQATSAPFFAIASSTGNLLQVNQNGAIAVSQAEPATTTTIVYDWNSANAAQYFIGGSATSITIINATTTLNAGSSRVLVACNPSGASGGALTLTGAYTLSGTFSTTAGKCNYINLYNKVSTSTVVTPYSYTVDAFVNATP